MAQIQGQHPPDRSPLGDSTMSDICYASVVRRSQQQRISKEDPVNRANRGHRANPRKREAVNPSLAGMKPEVNRGSGMNFDSRRSEDLARYGSMKKRQCVGVLVTRLIGYTSTRDVAKHVYNVTGLS